MYVTEIDRDFAGDTLFPAFDRAQWRETARAAVAADGLAFAFVTYARAPAPEPPEHVANISTSTARTSTRSSTRRTPATPSRRASP